MGGRAFGLIGGGLLLLGLLACLFYCAFRMRYLERCLWVTLLLTWIAGVSALTWEYRKPTWLLFALLTAHAYSQSADERQGGQNAMGRKLRQDVQSCARSMPV